MTDAPPAEIQTLIDAHVKGFNTQNDDLFLSVFGDTAVIIDGIAPYRWLNPNAPANWLTDVEKWRQDLGVTHEQLSYEMGSWNVEGSSAYAVISGTLTVTIKGQSVVRTGTLAYTFATRDGVWKIEAQAWGRMSQGSKIRVLPTFVLAARKRMTWILRLVIAAIAAVVRAAPVLFAQSPSSSASSGDTAELAKTLSNPISDLVSVPFQVRCHQPRRSSSTEHVNRGRAGSVRSS
jgi:hypothetical protein